MGIYGQDWASYQSATPDTSGLSFVFVKITEGLGYTNPVWVSQRADVKGAGLVWGAYHYPHMHDSAYAEADFFLSKVTFQPGDLVVLDWEGYDAANQGVSAAEQLAYKESYLAYMKTRLPHNPVGLYCNLDYWRNVDTTGHRGDFLWIATAGLPAGQPGIQAPWLFHQYGDAGVDRDYCNLNSLADLKAWALSFSQEADMPATPADAQLISQTLLNTTIASPFRKDAKGNPAQISVATYLEYMDKHFDDTVALINSVKAQNVQLQTAVAALSAGLAKVAGGGVDPAVVAQDVLKELSAALGSVK
jgi:hypothetical protein